MQPGEQQTVRFTLEPRDFAVYDPAVGAWTAGGGPFEVRIGASSRDIRLHAPVTVAAQDSHRPALTRLTRVREWLRYPAGRQALIPILNAMMRAAGGAEPDPDAATRSLDGFIGDMPISKLVMFGALSEADLAALITAASAPGAAAGT